MSDLYKIILVSVSFMFISFVLYGDEKNDLLNQFYKKCQDIGKTKSRLSSMEGMERHKEKYTSLKKDFNKLVDEDIDIKAPVVRKCLIDNLNREINLRYQHGPDVKKEFYVRKLISSLWEIKPIEMLNLFIKNYADLNTRGIANLIAKMDGQVVEEYQLLFTVMVNDKRNIPFRGGEPPPYERYEYRLCDKAHNRIIHSLYHFFGYPRNFKFRRLGNRMLPAKRDEQIKAFQVWWEKNSAELLKDKKQLFPEAEAKEFDRKLEKLAEKIAVLNKKAEEEARVKAKTVPDAEPEEEEDEEEEDDDA